MVDFLAAFGMVFVTILFILCIATIITVIIGAIRR